jgi:hypothetical protein
MELITIKREPIEVVHSKRKRRIISLTATTLPALTKAIDAVVQSFANEGFPLHRLSFYGSEDDDGQDYVNCEVTASRMETPEETAKRVAGAEAYNARQIAEHKQKVESSKRRKELERLTAHLTLEQLQAMKPVSPEGTT